MKRKSVVRQTLKTDYLFLRSPKGCATLLPRKYKYYFRDEEARSSIYR